MRNLLIILLLALTAAKIAAVLASGPVPIERDAFGYWRLSALVMGGDILMLSEPIAYRTPVYPWFVAIVRSFSGSFALQAIAIAQGLLSLATIWMAGHLAVRITRLPRAMPWTLAVSLPAVSALTFGAAVLSETLFVFLFMLNLLAVLDYAKYGTQGRAVWIGATFAVALLTRPIVLLLWIPHLFFMLYIHVRKRRRLGKQAPGRIKLHHRAGHALLAAVTIGVLIAPWLMRNHALFGKPFLTEFVGRNIWVVTFQDGSGAGLALPVSEASENLQRRLADGTQAITSAPDFDPDDHPNIRAEDGWKYTWNVSNALVASNLDDSETDRLMKQVSIEAIEANREAFAYKAFRRVVNFWRCAATDLLPQGPAAGNFRGQRTWGWVMPPIDLAIKHRWSNSVVLNTLLTAFLGAATLYLIFNFYTRPYAIWFALMFCYFAIVTGVFEIPAYRYRIVLEPLVATTFGAAIAVLFSRRNKPVKVVSKT